LDGPTGSGMLAALRVSDRLKHIFCNVNSKRTYPRALYASPMMAYVCGYVPDLLTQLLAGCLILSGVRLQILYETGGQDCLSAVLLFVFNSASMQGTKTIMFITSSSTSILQRCPACAILSNRVRLRYTILLLSDTTNHRHAVRRPSKCLPPTHAVAPPECLHRIGRGS
jgi:hypothetical protein